MHQDIYDIEVTDIEGQTYPLERYRGKVLLIVNTASRCGFTSQYKELESLYQKYNDQGLVILAFPCNQFGQQEPDDETAIQNFCELNFGVTFPLHQKIEVNGQNTHPLYQVLKKSARGFLFTQQIKWNFTKFIVNTEGQIITRFAPQDSMCKVERALREAMPHLALP
tara:strand:- start:32642 stop:33142 length:501 start_codon:yes stop_codon:yes gene_type:complete